MFDHFSVDFPNGFPDHPHRGFETITYMLSGTCIHEDFKGNKGEITSGGVQWMTAGKGIVHADMPKEGNMQGIQIWVNLKAKYKKIDPTYQEKASEHIEKFIDDGVVVKVIAGEYQGVKAEVLMRTEILFFDVELNENKIFRHVLSKNWNCLIYVLHGLISIGGNKVKTLEAAVLSKFGNEVYVNADENSRILIIAGEKISESISQKGPFVMNSDIEIQEAFSDFAQGINGFEGAKSWKSSLIH